MRNRVMHISGSQLVVNRINKLGVRVLISLGILALVGRACPAQVAAPQLENFESVKNTLPDGWKVVSGNWHVKEGALVADSMNSEAYIAFGETSWQNYEVEAAVTFHQKRCRPRNSSNPPPGHPP